MITHFVSEPYFDMDRRRLQLELDLLLRVLDKVPEIAQIAALIYLVLKLQEHKFREIQARNEQTRYVIDALIGLLDEAIARQNPDKLSARQVQYVKEWVEKMVGNGEQTFDKSQ